MDPQTRFICIHSSWLMQMLFVDYFHNLSLQLGGIFTYPYLILYTRHEVYLKLSLHKCQPFFSNVERSTTLRVKICLTKKDLKHI